MWGLCGEPAQAQSHRLFWQIATWPSQNQHWSFSFKAKEGMFTCLFIQTRSYSIGVWQVPETGPVHGVWVVTLPGLNSPFPGVT